jgi:hypothetical protein
MYERSRGSAVGSVTNTAANPSTLAVDPNFTFTAKWPKRATLTKVHGGSRNLTA